MKYYNKNVIPLAKKLRKNPTKRERHLWYDFLRTYPVKFQRQKTIGNYIADFYCAKAGIVIELDGKIHWISEVGRKDLKKEEYFESLGLKVLRFENVELNKNFSKVCDCIEIEVKKSLGII